MGQKSTHHSATWKMARIEKYFKIGGRKDRQQAKFIFLKISQWNYFSVFRTWENSQTLGHTPEKNASIVHLTYMSTDSVASESSRIQSDIRKVSIHIPFESYCVSISTSTWIWADISSNPFALGPNDNFAKLLLKVIHNNLRDCRGCQ